MLQQGENWVAIPLNFSVWGKDANMMLRSFRQVGSLSSKNCNNPLSLGKFSWSQI